MKMKFSKEKSNIFNTCSKVLLLKEIGTITYKILVVVNSVQLYANRFFLISSKGHDISYRHKQRCKSYVNGRAPASFESQRHTSAVLLLPPLLRVTNK